MSDEEVTLLSKVVDQSEARKGVITVLITSLLQKVYDPQQDVRYHQDNLPGGYSGRGVDERFVTPFMKEKRFPAMAESGWLTRSLEQNAPYTIEYKGRITPVALGQAFLRLLELVEEHNRDPERYLVYILGHLIIKRDSASISLATPTGLSISTIVNYLERHFNERYGTGGASRLPELAIYAVYECLLKEVVRYSKKQLMPLQEHTSADRRSGWVGDIEVRDLEGRVFECVEIKHGIPVTLGIVKDAYSKFSVEPVKRYYILSTAGYNESERQDIETEVVRIARSHGCQVIVNGITESLKYYLRLLDDTSLFVERYVHWVEVDKTLKYEHREMWNRIVNDTE